jgi:branched-chain amino acid transport system permease protein
MGLLLLSVGIGQSWSVSLGIINLCLISAIMSLGVNIQWGYAGLFNVGIMGFAAVGGLAAVLVATEPVNAAWSAGGAKMLLAGVTLLVGSVLTVCFYRWWGARAFRKTLVFILSMVVYMAVRYFYDPASDAIEAVDASKTGYLGGMGMPILFSWIVGGLFAAGVAWLIGKITLGLRSDYLAIATLGISEIIIALLKNEDWLTRGVKNVTALPRPVPFEIDLQQSAWFIQWVEKLNHGQLSLLTEVERTFALKALVVESSGLFVKLCFSGLFLTVLIIIFTLSALALNSPWGRMVRAIRDNEVAASAMGKNITARHLQIFIIGSAVIGIAGAMLTTLDGQFTPGAYHPLRFTFLIWVMVVVGGSGNNLGAILGGFLVWFLWVEAEPIGNWLLSTLTQGLDPGNAFRLHLLQNVQYMRPIIMGLVLLLVMRFTPGGILPERRNPVN